MNDSLGLSSESFPWLLHSEYLWRLVSALWASETAMVKDGDDEASLTLAKREALSAWLEHCVQEVVNEDVDFVHSISSSSSEKNLDMAFAYLTGKQVKAAAEMMVLNQEHRLCTLIAQCLNDDIRQSLAQQLEIWTSNGKLEAMNPKRVRLLSLLAGQVSDVARAVDWKRCFGLYVWFG